MNSGLIMIEQDVDGLSNSLWEGLLRPNIFFFPMLYLVSSHFVERPLHCLDVHLQHSLHKKPALIQKINKERHSAIVFAFRIGVIIDSRPDGKHYTAIIPTVDKRP